MPFTVALPPHTVVACVVALSIGASTAQPASTTTAISVFLIASRTLSPFLEWSNQFRRDNHIESIRSPE